MPSRPPADSAIAAEHAAPGRGGNPSRRPRRRLLGALALVRRQSETVLQNRVPGAGGAAGALARLWAWQLWRRVVRRAVVIRCAEGSLLYAPSWSRAAAMIASTGLMEREDALFVLDLLRDGDLFVDVGANVGFYTMLAGRRGARVEAFEPTPEAHAACEAGISLNGLAARVRAHRAACGAAAGVVRFTTGLDVSNHVVPADEPGIDVPVSTLDSELAGAAAPMTMLKVDAEGHDLDVLRGGIGTIERSCPVILVEVWLGGSGPLRLLEPWGYRAYSYDAVSRTLAEIEPGGRRSGNMLLIADAQYQAVRDRVAAAERPPLRAPSIRWLASSAEPS